jgi:hypothetical protein
MRILCWTALLGLVIGCTGPDTTALVAKDASAGADGSKDGSAGASNDAGQGGGGQQVPQDAAIESSFSPDGPSVFTFLHGIPNARAVRVCFEVQDGAGFSLTTSPPLPEKDLGLLFGRAFSTDSLTDVDLALQAIRPVVIGGALEIIVGNKCHQIDLSTQGLFWEALPALPAGTLDRGRSVLMVAAGCFSEPHEEEDSDVVCGPDFVPNKGNLRLLVASMERTPLEDTMGIQVFAASLGSSRLSVDHVAASTGEVKAVVRDLVAGKMAPRPPFKQLSLFSLGTEPQDNRWRVFVDNSAESEVDSLLPDALEKGGLTLDDLQDRKNFTIVLVGPKPGMEGSWFKSHSVVMIPSAP